MLDQYISCKRDVSIYLIRQLLKRVEFFFGAYKADKLNTELFAVKVARKIKDIGFEKDLRAAHGGLSSDVGYAEIFVTVKEYFGKIYSFCGDTYVLRYLLIYRRKTELAPQTLSAYDI